MGCFDVCDGQPLGQLIRQWVICLDGGVERLTALLREHDELCSAVVRVGLELDQSVLPEIIDDALNILAVRAKVAREPCHRLWTVRGYDRTENLPACAGEPEGCNKPVAPRNRQIVHPEQREDEIRQRFTRWIPADFGHLSPSIYIDIMMSSIYVLIMPD